jgi:hypothetical protein
MWRSIPDQADAARCTKNWTPSRFPVLKNRPWTGFAVERANQPGLPVPRHTTGSLATQQGWDGLVFQLAKAVWNPPRPSYFADDLVDTQRLGVAAAERCQHVLWRRCSLLVWDSVNPTVPITRRRSSPAHARRTRVGSAMPGCSRRPCPSVPVRSPFVGQPGQRLRRKTARKFRCCTNAGPEPSRH